MMDSLATTPLHETCTETDLTRAFQNVGGIITDFWATKHGIQKVGREEVAYCEYRIYVEGYDDPVHYRVWRDPKAPRKLLSENIDS